MRTLVICTLPRTGSSFLSEQIRLTDTMGRPREYFHPNQRAKLTEEFGLPADDLKAYAAAIMERRASPTGVVSMKLMVTHVRQLVDDDLLPEPGLSALIELFGPVGDATIVTLYRADKLRQAISLVRARQTGQWSSLKGRQALEKHTGAEPEFDKAELQKAIVRLVELEALWDRELAKAGLTPALEVTYEQAVRDVAGTVARVAAAVGVDLPPADEIETPPEDKLHHRQRDFVTDEWIERFLDG